MKDMKPFLEKIQELEEPWFIKDITLNQQDSRIDIYLDFRKGGTFLCPLCATGDYKVHDTAEKTWRHHVVTVPWAHKGSGFTLIPSPD